VSLREPSAAEAVAPATVCAFAMIANQVAGKATRDALFLTSFDVTSLPRMVIASALLTMAAVPLASRALSRMGPRRLVPAAFVASAAAQLAIRALLDVAPRAAAAALYLHLAAFGAVLISWFWSLISERFDPRTAKRRIGHIAGGGTLGGLLGGIAAERAAGAMSVGTLLVLLAVLHAVCAGAAVLVGRGAAPAGRPSEEADRPPRTNGLEVLGRLPYLRNLGLLVLMTTVGAALLDYVFKLRATEALVDRQALLRFFALFYTAVSALTFVLQSTVTRRLLERIGLARTASSLPLFLGAGGLTALLVPGLPSIGVVRGGEAAVRSSLFRSSYELFYTPVAPGDKRATKTIVDVGFDRLGDAIGGGLVQLVLAMGWIGTGEPLVGMAAALGLGGLLFTRRLHAGYVRALESSLVKKDAARERDAEAANLTMFLEPGSQLELTTTLPDLETGLASGISTTSLELTRVLGSTPAPSPGETAPSPPPPPADPLTAAIAALRSGEADRARTVLRDRAPLAPELVAHVIPLLAWDAVTADAVTALRAVVDRHTGQLLDALLDPDEEFTVRRRLPRVLAAATSPRAVQGLLAGLRDRRFEVRYQCGSALARIHERNPALAIDHAAIHAAVEKEARVDRRVWESHHLLDEHGADASPLFGDVLRRRSSRSLEHVFTLLSLVFPSQPLRIAYRGLHTEDENLRGTALEYLESILPPTIQDCLWPFLDDRRRARHDKPADAVLDSLLKSHESIRISLDKLRRRAEED